MLFTHVAINIWIFFNATVHFEEFNNFVAAKYPGQELPQQTIIKPRRDYSGDASFIVEEDVDILKQVQARRIISIKHCPNVNENSSLASISIWNLTNIKKEDWSMKFEGILICATQCIEQ